MKGENRMTYGFRGWDFEWEWADTWQLLGFAAVLVAAVLAVYALVTPKKVDGYYLEMNTAGTICVYDHWNWRNDSAAFCTDDKEKALDFALRANALVKK